MPYGIDVPLVHASAAIRRIIALAYLLVWSWHEHVTAAKQRRGHPAGQIVLLIDEVEAHLHPAWQKRVLPSLLAAVQAMTASPDSPSVQIIASTHSPLVCVSLEQLFDEEKDQLFDLDLDPQEGVRLEAVPFVKRGTEENWLVSRHFDLKSGYSEEAQAVMDSAAGLVQKEIDAPGSVKKSAFVKRDRELRAVLSETDSFWVTWRRIGEKKGWLR